MTDPGITPRQEFNRILARSRKSPVWADVVRRMKKFMSATCRSWPNAIMFLLNAALEKEGY